MEIAGLEYKSLPLTKKDFSTEKRTVVFAHATYNNIDRLGDISRPGMFDKSWSESKAGIYFLEDHSFGKKLGVVTDVWEDKAAEQAFTAGKFANTTRGNDMMEMVDMGMVSEASFGFKAIKSSSTTIKGRKVRELKEVFHGESTLANELAPVNPLSTVKFLQKAMNVQGLELKALSDNEQAFLSSVISRGISVMRDAINLADSLDTTSDLYNWIMYFISGQASWIGDARSNLRWGTKAMESAMLDLKSFLPTAEKFVREAKASDECIQQIDAELKAAQHIISLYDTAITHEINEPGASGKSNANESETLAALKLLNLKISMS